MKVFKTWMSIRRMGTTVADKRIVGTKRGSNAFLYKRVGFYIAPNWISRGQNFSISTTLLPAPIYEMVMKLRKDCSEGKQFSQ